MKTFIVRSLTAAFVITLALCIPAAVRAQAPELAAKGVWNSSTAYIKDDIVTARGSAWIARRANTNRLPGQTSPSTAADWLLFARGFNPMGAWSNVPTYQPDDLVTRLGQTWRAKRTVAAGGAAPAAGANWELFAQKGDPGPNTGIGSGTQSVPSISFNGDPNTGIFSPAADKIAIVEGGLLFLHNKGTRTAALGLEALSSNTTGSDNTAVGNSALKLNVTGDFNTALGAQALTNSTQSANTGLGYRALEATTTGQFNTGVGYRPLLQNMTGSDNTAVGRDALADNTASNNTAVGSQALAANTTGTANVAVGRQALTNNTIGYNNVAVGFQAMALATQSTGSIAIGVSALSSLNAGGGNIAIGSSAQAANVAGADNIAIGDNAMTGNTSDYNVAIGGAALNGNTTGTNNIALGKNAGVNATAPDNSIFIGNTGVGGDSNTIKIGTQGTQTTAFMAGIFGATVDNGSGVAVVVDNAGQLGTLVSSRRYKYDIETMADMSTMLAKLRPVTFRYKQAQDGGAHPLQYGLIAEEVADVFPDLAVFKDGQPETVKYHLLPNFLLAGYQAQQKTIAAQAEKIETQATDVADLKDRLRRLEALLPQTRAAALQ